jgi:phospholipid-binding lipoprotein MlaA
LTFKFGSKKFPSENELPLLPEILIAMSKKSDLTLTVFIFVCMCMPVFGCAHNQSPNQAYDPLESINRYTHDLNNSLDRVFLKPVADSYLETTHPNFRLTVSNFYDNLGYLNVILNDFLQGKFNQGISDSGRFLLNTTLGVGGLFDAATVFGFEKHHEDFGQTLAVWGVGDGPYLEAPLIGPTTSRDILDKGSSTLTNVFFYVSLPVIVAGVTFIAPVVALGVIDKRSRMDDVIQARDDMSVDSYVFTREAYLQNRKFKINDGQTSTEDLYDTTIFDEFEELEENEESIEDLAQQADLQTNTSFEIKTSNPVTSQTSHPLVYSPPPDPSAFKGEISYTYPSYR